MGKFDAFTKKYTDAFNRRDVEAYGKLYANDAVVIDPFYPTPLVGRNAQKEDLGTFLRGFSDLRLEFVKVVESNDGGAFEVRMTGTNDGPLTTPAGEMPPTGKRIDLRGAGFIRLSGDGLVLEEHRYYDSGVLMRQLGPTPEPAATATR